MFKKCMIVLLIGSFGGQIHSMKRSFEGAGALASPSKKQKMEAGKSLFDYFEEGNLKGFEQEVKNRAQYDQPSLYEQNSSGDSILSVVGESKKEDADQYFKALMVKGVNIDHPHDVSGATELASGCLEQDFDRIERALSYKANPNVASKHGIVPLHYFLHTAISDFSSAEQDVVYALYAKTDLNRKNGYGDTFMHSRLLQKQAATRLSLYGGDVDALNAVGKKPFETCWDAETYELLKSRKANRENAIMPVMKEVAKSQDFKHADNFPHMPNSVPKSVFNRGINGPRELNLNRLVLKHRQMNEPKDEPRDV